MGYGELKQVDLGSGLNSTRYKRPVIQPCLARSFLIPRARLLRPLPLGCERVTGANARWRGAGGGGSRVTQIGTACHLGEKHSAHAQHVEWLSCCGSVPSPSLSRVSGPIVSHHTDREAHAEGGSSLPKVMPWATHQAAWLQPKFNGLLLGVVELTSPRETSS